MHDLGLLRTAPNIPAVNSMRQSYLEAPLYLAQFLNICLTLAKANLLHIILLTSSPMVPAHSPPNMLSPQPIYHSPAIIIFGVWVDYRLSLSKHVYFAASKKVQAAACVKTIARVKHLSPVAMYYVVTTTAISVMLWAPPPGGLAPAWSWSA